jgi:CubicO group peptidase (beta-lactamase class C family)
MTSASNRPGRLVTLVLTVTVLACLLAFGARADQIDRYVETQLQRQHIPGLSLVIIRDGHVAKMRGYGFADLELKVPATPDTVLEIGSITKQFTAMAIMLLVEQGGIDLSDPAGKYLPQLPDAWKAVTIRQLLTHTSGIPDYEEIMGYDGYRNPMAAEQVIALAASKPMDFQPGTKWSYSNTGYFLLTLILEKVSGQPYASFVKQRILEPAGMTHTRSSEPVDVIPDRASGYVFEKGHMENRDPMQPTATGGAGMLVSTVKDLAKWNTVLDRQSILAQTSYAQMWADAPLADGSSSGYGFGWFVSPMREHRSQNHSGGTAGFSSNILRLPDDRVTVIVLTNTGSANAVSITNHIARVLVPSLAYAPIREQDPQVAQMVMDFYTHRLDPEVYDKPLSAELAAKVRPYWAANHEYFQALGPPLTIEPVERSVEGTTRVYRYRVRYADTSRLVLVTLDANSLITNMQAEEE